MVGLTGLKRVKSGCVTCRIRRVKCDEQKPECQRCLSTGRKCDGYSTLPFSRRDLQAASQSVFRQRGTPDGVGNGQDRLLPRLVTDPAFGDLLEKRYFQFFRQRTVVSTNRLVDSRFWDRVVLQACHTEPCIKHAVLALSSLHQLATLHQDCETASQHRLYAERQHHKALIGARSLIASASPEDVDKVLIACIIFIVFEGVRGNYKASAMHMDSGRAIIAQNSERLRNPSRRKDLLEIEHALARLDIPAITFSDRSSPYHYKLPDFKQTNPNLTPAQFQDVNEAQASFVDLLRWLLVLVDHIEREWKVGDIRSMARYQAEKIRCAERIEQWHDYFEDAARRSESSANPLILNLRLWHASALLLIEAEAYGPELRYDAIIPRFEKIVRHGEMISEQLVIPNATRTFSFDLGYTIPVFFTATRCRDPVVRRRAVKLLHNFPRQEGVWESVAAAAIATRWIAVEEAGLGVVRCAADIPEHRRIKFIDTELDVESRAASLKFTSPALDTREIEIEWREQGTKAVPSLDLVDDLRMCANNDKIPTFDIRRAGSSSGASNTSSTTNTSPDPTTDDGSRPTFSRSPSVFV